MIPTLFLTACLTAAPHVCPLVEIHYDSMSACQSDTPRQIASYERQGFRVTLPMCVRIGEVGP